MIRLKKNEFKFRLKVAFWDFIHLKFVMILMYLDTELKKKYIKSEA